MPQIWVDDIELAAILGCAPSEARQHAIEAGLSRRRCSDGATRTKVPPGLLGAVVARFFAATVPGRGPEQPDITVAMADRTGPASSERPRPLPLAA